MDTILSSHEEKRIAERLCKEKNKKSKKADRKGREKSVAYAGIIEQSCSITACNYRVCQQDHAMLFEGEVTGNRQSVLTEYARAVLRHINYGKITF